MDELRTVEVKNSNGIWNKIEFTELKKGDVFRMFESDGELVKNFDNKTEFLATSYVYMDKELQQYIIEIGKADK